MPIPAIRIAGMGLGSVWGMGSLLRTFWTGGTLVLTNPAEALTAIGRYKVTSLAMAPISLQGIVAARPDGAGPIPSLTAIEVAGSLMPPRLLALTRARLCPHVVSLYGATEIEGVASAPFAALDGNSQAVGYVFNNVEIEAVDEHDRPLPAGSEGILRMRGENMAPGYFRDPETTARVFRDGWFYCGDTGAVTPEGLLTITGRVEEFINAGGNKISPRVIEDILLSVPDVTEAAAFGVPDRMGVIQIWAAIVASRTIPLADLTATCHAKLPGRAPKYIVQMQALPRNQNGKVLKEELVRYLTVNQP